MMIPTRSLPSLAALRAFECAARHGSFTLAAEELHLTQSAVSRQVKDLEAQLGFSLFRRNGRRVALTDAGGEFSRALAVDLDRLKQTVSRAITAGNARTSLRIATLSTFASRWLIPRLPEFEAKFPEVEISLATRLRPFSFEDQRFDLAIHHGTADWPDTQMSRLCGEEILAVAAPAFLQKHQLEAAAASRIAAAPLLHLETRPGQWAEWLLLQGVEGPDFPRGKLFDQFSMIISAASHGLGAALLPRYLIEDELESGALQLLPGEPMITENAYWIVTPAGIASPVAQAFARWVKTRVSKGRFRTN